MNDDLFDSISNSIDDIAADRGGLYLINRNERESVWRAVCEHAGCKIAFTIVTMNDHPDEIYDVLEKYEWEPIFCPSHKSEAVWTIEQMRNRRK